MLAPEVDRRQGMRRGGRGQPRITVWQSLCGSDTLRLSSRAAGLDAVEPSKPKPKLHAGILGAHPLVASSLPVGSPQLQVKHGAKPGALWGILCKSAQCSRQTSCTGTQYEAA